MGMARAPTTRDPFNAVAEPKRRQLLDTLGTRERSVNEIGEALDWPQPTVSKHLAVLKKVGLVSERRVGRQRLYRVNAEQLKPIYEWVTPFERIWSERFERLDQVLQELQEKEKKHVRKTENRGHRRTRKTGSVHHP
jgi:DNA-binding transcriptional ArsR family regulator